MTIFIIALEPIESRYTCQWYDGIPKLLDGHDIVNVPGWDAVRVLDQKTTECEF